jgi:CYTH domain-containing protein
MYGDKARVEIERKFLVTGDGWKADADEGVRVRQGFLSGDENGVVRVRRVLDKGVLTIKGPTRGISREEFEYTIPAADAERMLDALCAGGTVDKTRYRIPRDGVVWEVDVFAGDNAGLVLAEVELDSEDQEVTLPDWLGEEVSRDPRFYNAYLARNPFTTWSDAGS